MSNSMDDQTYLKNLTILYVEDEEESLGQFSRFFSRTAGSLITARNGAEGLEAYRAHKPDIIVTDIQMPVMDGLSMAVEIRKLDKSVPIIALTAYCDSEYLMKSINIGIDRYIAKPVDGSLMQEALQICAHRLMLEEEMRRSRGQLTAAGETVPDMMLVLDAEGNCLQVHAPRKLLLAAPKEALNGKNIKELFPEDAAITVLKALQAAASKGTDYGRTISLKLEQSEHCFELSVARKNGVPGEPHRFIMHSRDITRRNRTEDELCRLKRDFRAVSACNNALTGICVEDDLLNEICRIIVEIGGYRLAWVGYAVHDEAKTVRPVASAGFEDEFPKTLKLSWADNEPVSGPSGTVIRTGRPYLALDLQTDANFGPWRVEALKRGYTSELILPLRSDDEIYGVIHICSDRRNAFDAEEMKLLDSLARTLCCGVSMIRIRTALKQAESALQFREEKLCRPN